MEIRVASLAFIEPFNRARSGATLAAEAGQHGLGIQNVLGKYLAGRFGYTPQTAEEEAQVGLQCASCPCER